MEQKESRLILLFAILVALALRFYLYNSIGYAADDALITLRYAENLSQGKGLVYNEGERVLGTTTPLLALLTAALLPFRIDGVQAFFILNQVADLATAFFLYRFFRDALFPLSVFPSLLFLFNPESIQWTLSGMETQVSIAFIFASIYFASVNRWNLAFLISAFAVWTRIDGIAVAVALTAAYVFRFKKFPLIPVAILLGALAPWIVFATFYFGSPIPNSAIAKASLSGQDYLGAVRDILIRGFLHLHTIGLPFLVLALIGTWNVCREKRQLLVLPVWTWGYAFSYTLAAGAMHPWYYVPFYAGYLVLSCVGFLALVGHLRTAHKRWVAGGVCAAAILIVLYLSYQRIDRIREIQDHLDAMNRTVGLWVITNSPQEATFAIKDIGYMGYYSRRRILDLAGLVSPQSIPFRARGDFLGPIKKFRPDYFAFSAGQIRNLKLKDSGLLNDYETASTIQNRFGSYTIFKRKSKT